MVKVYNHYHNNIPPGSVHVGRPSEFGNPFTHLAKSTSAPIHVPNRNDAVRAFDTLIMDCFYTSDVIDKIMPMTIEEGRALLLRAINIRAGLWKLRGKNLVCFCAPLPCHADTLLREANKPMEEVDP